MIHKGYLRAILLVGIMFTAVACASGPVGDGSKQQLLVDEAAVTVQNFANDPQMSWLRENLHRAKAVMVVPDQVKGGFIVGGSGGSGTLLFADQSTNTWSNPAFFTMGSATVGFQIGGEVSEVMLMIMTDAGRNALLNPSLKLGADISVAAGPVGGGAKVQTADIIAFARSKGLYGGVNVEGAVIAPRGEWNHAYYGEHVTPEEILVEGTASNIGANRLRAVLASTASGS